MTKTSKFKEYLSKFQKWIEVEHGTDVIMCRRKSGTVAGCYVDMKHVAKCIKKRGSARLVNALNKGNISIDNWRPIIMVMYPPRTTPKMKLAILIHEIGHKVLKHKDIHLKSKKKINSEEIDAWKAGIEEAYVANGKMVGDGQWLFNQIDKIEEQFDKSTSKNSKQIEMERDAIIMLAIHSYQKEQQ